MNEVLQHHGQRVALQNAAEQPAHTANPTPHAVVLVARLAHGAMPHAKDTTLDSRTTQGIRHLAEQR